MNARLNLAIAATLLSCRSGTPAVTRASDSGTVDGGASGGKAERRCYNVPDFHCDMKWSRDVVQTAVVEHHLGAYLFCYHSIELESKESIEIKARKEGDELNEWLLDVGGIQVHVRQDTEWADMEAHGWGPREIERVWYPEASGRSARRVAGNTIRRETNVVFMNSLVAGVHFAYVTTLDPWAVDEMIDRAHSPWHRDWVSCDAGM
jgi:hypothetical protein